MPFNIRVLHGIFLSLCLLAHLGCENTKGGATEAGAIGAGLLGAGMGAIIGHKTGHLGEGIAIGAGAGMLAGAAVGNELDKTNDAIAERDRVIEEQQRQIDENRKMVEELKRRGADVLETDRGVVINLPDVLFEFDSADLTKDAVFTVQDIAEVANDFGDRKISVEGHTDSVGTLDYNQKLSRERARSAADELVKNGVDKSRIRIHGYGETRPLSTNSTEYGRQRNRRVEVVVLN